MFGKTVGRNQCLQTRETMMMREKRIRSNPTNETTADLQYEREMRKLEAKKRRRQMLSDSRRIAICGSKHERSEVQRGVKKEIDKMLAFKKQEAAKNKNDDREKVGSAVTKEKEIFDREAMKKQEKREYLRKMMEENKRLVSAKKVQNKEERTKEIERANKEVEFFDKYKSYI